MVQAFKKKPAATITYKLTKEDLEDFCSQILDVCDALHDLKGHVNVPPYGVSW
jgi:hypothetical protein